MKLLASKFERNDSNICSLVLARHFFERVGVLWENNPIIALRDTEEVPSMGDIRTTTMSIISTRSAGNLGISSTISTTQTTKNELFRAKSLFDGMTKDTLIWPSSLQKVLMEPVHRGNEKKMLALGVSMNRKLMVGGGGIKPADIKAWSAVCVLRLTVALERIISSDSIRPYSRPTVIRDGDNTSFWFYIGIRRRFSR